MAPPRSPGDEPRDQGPAPPQGLGAKSVFSPELLPGLLDGLALPPHPCVCWTQRLPCPAFDVPRAQDPSFKTQQSLHVYNSDDLGFLLCGQRAEGQWFPALISCFMFLRKDFRKEALDLNSGHVCSQSFVRAPPLGSAVGKLGACLLPALAQQHF